MNTQAQPVRRAMTTVLRAASFLLICAMPGGVSAAPPQKREPVVVRGLEKVGDFFFKVARRLEQHGFPEDDPELRFREGQRRAVPRRVPPETADAGPSTGLVLPPGHRARPMPDTAGQRSLRPQPPRHAHPSPRGETFVPPNFQPNPQPRLSQPQQPQGRSSMSLPVPQGSAGARGATPPAGLFDPPATPPAREASPGPEEQTKRVVMPPEPAGPSFATPVPGKKGFVYPPGVGHELKNMVDVRDFDAGQKVRDPRTGEVFLVPPK